MNPFKLRRQKASTDHIGVAALCQWAEMKTDDIKIVIDGSKTESVLRITVEVNGIRYMLTDVLLEMMLGKVAEEYPTSFLSFNVYNIDQDGKIT